jgi:hypothetical protein
MRPMGNTGSVRSGVLWIAHLLFLIIAKKEKKLFKHSKKKGL